MAGIEWTGMMKEEVDNMPKEAIPCLQSYTGLIYNSYNRSSLSYNPTAIKETSNNRRSQIGGKIIKGDFTRNVRKAIQEEIITTYYKRKLGDSYNTIDWAVFKKALEKKRAKGALLKMIHGITPTQKHMKKIRLTMHADCPSCKAAEEDIHHILNCAERAHKTNEIFMREFKKNYKNLQENWIR